MTAPQPTALPYGLRDVKLTPYTDSQGTTLATGANKSVDLPNSRVFSFSEEEAYDELEGDDRTVTTVGKGPTVKWELEAGGISLESWVVMAGGAVVETGVAPARVKTFTKRGSSTRPWFRAEGQAISDSGGDVHGVVYRCRANAKFEGKLEHGNFFITACGGQGFPLLDTSDDLLYAFVQNEGVTSIPTTPVPNP